MSRRGGRKGAWLATDDYTGVVCFASELQKDFWGAWTKKPLERNLQEISSPLNDPRPVPLFRGPNYETVTSANIAPAKIGLTNINTTTDNAAFQSGVVKF